MSVQLSLGTDQSTSGNNWTITTNQSKKMGCIANGWKNVIFTKPAPCWINSCLNANQAWNSDFPHSYYSQARSWPFMHIV